MKPLLLQSQSSPSIDCLKVLSYNLNDSYIQYICNVSKEESMAHLPASKARQDFADTINRAAYGKERVVVRRRGKEIAAVVPIDDLRLLEELEDRIDLADARAALAETRKKGAKSLDAILKEMGL